MSLDISLKEGEIELHSQNITHNLGRMAEELRIYTILWGHKPVANASKLIEPLTQAIERMKADPDKYRQFDASNGWGTYDDFLPWLIELRNNCENYPDASVSCRI